MPQKWISKELRAKLKEGGVDVPENDLLNAKLLNNAQESEPLQLKVDVLRDAKNVG